MLVTLVTIVTLVTMVTRVTVVTLVTTCNTCYHTATSVFLNSFLSLSVPLLLTPCLVNYMYMYM